MPIVDAHHHLFGVATDPLFYRRTDLEQDLSSGHRVMGTVYVEAYGSAWSTDGPVAMRSVGEVEMIVRSSQTPIDTPQGPCQLAAGIVSNVDLLLGDDVAEVLEAHVTAGQQRLCGVRHHAAHVDGAVGKLNKTPPKPDLLLDAEFRRGLACLDRFGLSFDAFIYHTQLDDLLDLADAFPDTRMVLNHVGVPIGVEEFRSQHATVLADWERGMRALAARPNVYLKVGGMGMPVFGFGFESGDAPASSDSLVKAWQPLIDTCIDAFGPERCMFESNFPVDKQSAGYAALWNAFKKATHSLTRDERSQLFYRTACRAYRLPELEKACDRAAQEHSQERRNDSIHSA